MGIEVREARAGDEPAVVWLIRELAASEGEAPGLTEQYVREYLAFPGASILLAEEDGQVLGLASCAVMPDLFHGANSGDLREMIVTAGARGRGVGGALISEAIRHFKAVGCAEISVSAMPGNEGAIRFYRSHGLVEEAVQLERHF